MAKSKKNKNKPKLNLTVREEQRSKLEQMASLEKRSLSNLIEVMADERWERLVEQQGIAYAKTVAEAMNLKLDADNLLKRHSALCLPLKNTSAPPNGVPTNGTVRGIEASVSEPVSGQTLAAIATQ